MHLAHAHNLSSYDAAYLELAIRLGLPLAALDGKLKRQPGQWVYRSLKESEIAAHFLVGEGEIRNCFGKLNDSANRLPQTGHLATTTFKIVLFVRTYLG